MADLPSLLAVLEHDPDDTQAFEALAAAARQAPPDLRASRFAATRKLLADSRPARCGRPADRRRARRDRRHRQAARPICCSRRAWSSTASCSTCRRRTPRSRRCSSCARTTRWRSRRSRSSTSPRRTGRSSPRSTSRRRARRPIAASRPGSTSRRPRRTSGSRPRRRRPKRYLRKALEIDPKNGKAAFHLARLLRRARALAGSRRAARRARREGARPTEEKVAALLALVRASRAAAPRQRCARASAR